MKLKYKLANEIKEKEFLILEKFKFSSKRQRISVVLKDPEGIILMYTKGSD